MFPIFSREADCTLLIVLYNMLITKHSDLVFYHSPIKETRVPWRNIPISALGQEIDKVILEYLVWQHKVRFPNIKQSKTTNQKEPQKTTMMGHVQETWEPTESAPSGPAKAEII